MSAWGRKRTCRLVSFIFLFFRPYTHLYTHAYADLGQMGPIDFLPAQGLVLDVYVNR